MTTRPDVYTIDNFLNTHTLIERHVTSNNKRVRKLLESKEIEILLGGKIYLDL